MRRKSPGAAGDELACCPLCSRPVGVHTVLTARGATGALVLPGLVILDWRAASPA
jgi:hypothetical protein